MRLGPVAAPGEGRDDLNASRLGQLRELVEVFLFYRATESDSNQDGALACSGSFKHPMLPACRQA